MIISGPGGVGKGTLVAALGARDPRLRVSRSWTTRARRTGEREDAYVWVSRDAFEAHARAGGFLEWTEFLGNYYGTPMPDDDPTHDLVLEIELHGARQVREREPSAVLIFVLPPSRAEQERRLRGRGDPDDILRMRLAKAEEEEPLGKAMADHVVVNDDLEGTVDVLLEILDTERAARS